MASPSRWKSREPLRVIPTSAIKAEYSEGISSELVLVKPVRERRSLDQNSLYWFWVTEFSQRTGYTKNSLHLFLKIKFLGVEPLTVFGHKISIPRSTTKLSTKEFSEYLENVHQYIYESIGEWFPSRDHFIELARQGYGQA